MKKKLILIAIAVVLVLAGTTWGLLSYNYSKGFRSGTLVKITKKGAFYKTYEGTLDLGSGDHLTWDFSIHDDQLGMQLEKQAGRLVKVEYKELLYKVFYDTKYVVESWSIVREAGSENFCRLVNIMRKSRIVVDKVKSLMSDYDAALLEEVRKCQN